MYQFIHVESYGRVSAKKKLNFNDETKGRNVKEIIGEVTRRPGYCDHVEDPGEPIILYGVNPRELEALTDDYFNNTKLVNSNGVKRGLRKDSHVLLAGVVSLNREVEEIWDDYKKEAIEWLKKKYGDRLKSVVEHTDEGHPHLHFYCVQDPGLSFDLLHEGKRAYAAVGGKVKHKKEIAFKNAMREFQESFFNDVSLKYGLMKTGPKRKRMSNSDYKRQQEEIRLINLFKNKTTEEMNLLITETEKEIKKQKEKSEKEINLLKDNAIALGKRLGRAEGFKSALSEVGNKNYFSKVIFSRSFSINRIAALEKRNNELLDKSRKIFDRKEYYKKVSIENMEYKNKYIEEEKKNNYLKTVNDLVENISKIENKKEIENDIRARVIAEVNRIETQQQQVNSGYEQIKQRDIRNRGTVEDFKTRIGKSARVLFNNIKTTIGDFLANKLLKNRSEKTEEIKTNIESLKKEYEIKIKEDPGINRSRKIKKI
ncbi:TPA: hypothetical protein OQM70_004127 [Shigella flexneri]|nr:hypothetical protein [Shigella flexneri]